MAEDRTATDRDGFLQMRVREEQAHNEIDLLDPYPPREVEGRTLTVAGRIVWWRDHRPEASYRRIGTVEKHHWNTIVFYQDGSVTLPPGRHVAYVVRLVDE